MSITSPSANLSFRPPRTVMTSKPPSASSDPLLKPLQTAGSSVSGSTKATTLALLSQAFPDPIAAQQIYSQKLEHKPLSVNPADSSDARTARRQKRLSQLKRKRKPKPLSAKEKRELRIYDIPKSEIRYSPARHIANSQVTRTSLR